MQGPGCHLSVQHELHEVEVDELPANLEIAPKAAGALESEMLIERDGAFVVASDFEGDDTETRFAGKGKKPLHKRSAKALPPPGLLDGDPDLGTMAETLFRGAGKVGRADDLPAVLGDQEERAGIFGCASERGSKCFRGDSEAFCSIGEVVGLRTDDAAVCQYRFCIFWRGAAYAQALRQLHGIHPFREILRFRPAYCCLCLRCKTVLPCRSANACSGQVPEPIG